MKENSMSKQEDVSVEDDNVQLARHILARMAGVNVEKMLMLLVMVKHDKISMEQLIDMCSNHHSTGGGLSKMVELIAMLRDEG